MKYALALSGGGARGAFEVGVWNALKEIGLNITAICGTSIGAINAALFINGCDAQGLWNNIEVTDIIDSGSENLLSFSNIIASCKPGGGHDLSQLKNFIAAHISEQKIRRSDILYGLCTYNINQKKSVELFIDDIPSGQLIEYIAASACFPGFLPVKINKEDYSDGGIQNNLPRNMLINRGYDTIISVSVKGVGFVQDIDQCGINIIDINCTTPETGLMEFDRGGIKKSIINGYLACMKAFGRVKGKYFSFDKESYDIAVSSYGIEFVSVLEHAAKELGIDSYRLYAFDDFVVRILEEYRLNPQFRHLAEFINKRDKNPIRSKLDILGTAFHSANAIVYASKNITKG